MAKGDEGWQQAVDWQIGARITGDTLGFGLPMSGEIGHSWEIGILGRNETGHTVSQTASIKAHHPSPHHPRPYGYSIDPYKSKDNDDRRYYI